jgi:hypothetical protein
MTKIKINVYDRLDKSCDILLGENDPPFFLLKKKCMHMYIDTPVHTLKP